MRTRRFRPGVDFRPGFDLLMPRIVPSDMSPYIGMDPTPDNPDPSDTNDPVDAEPPAIPPATVTLTPTNYEPGADDPDTTGITLGSPTSTSTPTFSC